MNLLELITIEEFDKLANDIDSKLTQEDKKQIIANLNQTLRIYPKQTFTKLQKKEFIKKHIELYHLTKNIKMQNSIKASHNFDWMKSYDLSLEAAQQYRLIKGVAMTEGEAKRGEIMTEENLRFGTGAMAASAMLGFAVLDIDHYPDALPTDGTYEKYDVEKINELYPLGMIIDANLSKNKVGTEGKELWQIEFVAICENEFVYQMIKKGTFKACSVMDFPREYSCDQCNAETGACTCNVEGSKFMYNTLVLEGVPNSDSTWVSVVDKKDIGSIVKPYGSKTSETIENRLSLSKLNRKHTLSHQIKEADVAKYQTDDGVWSDGVDSIKSFLIEEKGINAEQAATIADYIFQNPSALNSEQLRFMSGDDMLSWFNNLNTINKAKLHSFIHQLEGIEKNGQASVKIELSVDQLKASLHVVQLTKEEVDYGEREEGVRCYQCRWFFTSDEEVTPESVGGCQIVEGDILGSDGCKRFEAIPGEEADDEEETDEEETEEEETQEEETEENSEESTVETPEEPTENDKAAKELELKELEEAANNIPTPKPKPKPSALLNEHSKSNKIIKIDDVTKQLNKLIAERNDIGLIIGRGREQTRKLAKYEKLTKQINELQAKKNKIK